MITFTEQALQVYPALAKNTYSRRQTLMHEEDI